MKMTAQLKLLRSNKRRKEGFHGLYSDERELCDDDVAKNEDYDVGHVDDEYPVHVASIFQYHEDADCKRNMNAILNPPTDKITKRKCTGKKK